MHYHAVEGTWEEVLSHASEFEKHRVRVIVLDEDGESKGGTGTLSPEEIEKRLQAWEKFTSEPLSDAPPLSDYALSRENMYNDERA
ncbi:hypothetical protein [Synechococcus sp. PCC 7336]|uniref:hypothetical protein n=1 Tax=Synechococcus sp. PCC 7336 TaxID=195250 RepID=UPI0003466609|nr:hypothetical protein [Synechococcus sp. PCC 7336]